MSAADPTIVECLSGSYSLQFSNASA